MNKKIIGSIIVIVVIIFAIVMIKKNNTGSTVVTENSTDIITQPVGEVKNETTSNSIPNTNPNPTSSTSTTSTTTTIKTFTLADVMTHNTEADCYSAINGDVYDLTAWIKKHPGGDRAILSICGLDGSAAFNGQHGSDKKPQNILAGFEVGVLTQ